MCSSTTQTCSISAFSTLFLIIKHSQWNFLPASNKDKKEAQNLRTQPNLAWPTQTADAGPGELSFKKDPSK